MTTHRILVATSNPGKLRDFAGVAEAHRVAIEMVPNFFFFTQVVEDGATFKANARKKAEAYSLAVPGELVLADDQVWRWMRWEARRDSLRSLRGRNPHLNDSNTKDHDNNARLLRELNGVPHEKRIANLSVYWRPHVTGSRSRLSAAKLRA